MILKGPSGCGKSFVIRDLFQKYRDKLYWNDHDVESASGSLDFERKNDTSSFFPSLQFEAITAKPCASTQFTDRRSLTIFKDSDFFSEDFGKVARLIERLNRLTGLVVLEITEIEQIQRITSFVESKFLKHFTKSQVISMNPLAPSLIKKSIEGLSPNLHFNIPELLQNNNNNCGDIRAFLHDLFIFSLKKDSFWRDHSNQRRDQKTEFFHLIGKLLYPAKTDERVYSAEGFWDALDLDLLLTFLQFYFPTFCPDLEKLSRSFDYFSKRDIVPWVVTVKYIVFKTFTAYGLFWIESHVDDSGECGQFTSSTGDFILYKRIKGDATEISFLLFLQEATRNNAETCKKSS